MADDQKHSNHYLRRNSAQEQAEAAKLLRWNWSPHALDLLTRYPRRGEEFRILTTEKVRELNSKLKQPFPEEMIVDFQREFGGVTYSTSGEDGEWVTWGLTYIQDLEEDYYESNEKLTLLCCQYNTARPDGYAVAADGRLWDESPVARTAIIELERIAYELEHRTVSGFTEQIRLVVTKIPIVSTSLLDFCHIMFQSIGWTVVAGTQDDYACLWSGVTGWAKSAPELETTGTMIFYAYFADTDHAAFCFQQIKKQLPYGDIFLGGMPTPTRPN